MAEITTNRTNTLGLRIKPANSTTREKSTITKATPMTLFSFPTELSKRESILVPSQYKEIASELQNFYLTQRRFTLDYKDLTAPYKEIYGESRQKLREGMRTIWEQKEGKKAALDAKVKGLNETAKKELLKIFTREELIKSTELFSTPGNNVYARDIRELLK